MIEKNLSPGWKGIIIIMIELGHNSLLCKYGSGEDDFYIWRTWIYTFHVCGFFALPFIYGGKKVSLHEYAVAAKKSFVKLFIPYSAITLLCVLIASMLGKDLIISKVLAAFVVGSQWMTSSYIGFHFLWFLPTMFSVILIRNLYFNVPFFCRLIIILVGVGVYIYSYAGLSLGFLNYLPFNFVEATKYALIGITCRYVLELNETYVKVIVHMVFIASSVFFLGFFDSAYFQINTVKAIIYFILPVSFSCFIVWYKKLGNNTILQFFGKYSLEVYLFHVIIYNVLLLVVQKFLQLSFHAYTIPLGLLLLVLTLAMSLGVGVCVDKLKSFSHAD